jgi:hypothetical protein
MSFDEHSTPTIGPRGRCAAVYKMRRSLERFAGLARLSQPLNSHYTFGIGGDNRNAETTLTRRFTITSLWFSKYGKCSFAGSNDFGKT